MKITKVEILSAREPIQLPEPWLPAWQEPNGRYATTFGLSLYKVYTDQDIVGYGPNIGGDLHLLKNQNPLQIRQFWYDNMSGKRAGNSDDFHIYIELIVIQLTGFVNPTRRHLLCQ